MYDIENNGKLIENMAEGLHIVFCKEMNRLGYKYSPVTDDTKKLHSSLVIFSELPEDEKEQNRSNARAIRNKIESIGYKIVPLNDSMKQEQLTNEEIEKLAVKEHQRWMKQKIKTGWSYGPITIKKRKLHAGIVPYEQLSEEEKNKDKILVRSIPKILQQSGYMMVNQSTKI